MGACGILALAVAACGQKKDDIADPLPPPAYGTEEQANVDLWLERMEVGGRELYSARFDVVDAVGLSDGARIADIGAGTGLYSLLFADKVGSDGVVFAVDIEPRFLTLINRRAADLDNENIVSVLGRDASITLPPGSVDIVFISDTYNYFEDPQKLMKSVHEALAPGGKLFVLDFDIKTDTPRNENNEHVRVGKEALASEIEASGFRLVEDVAVEGLSETYMLRFEKV